MGIIIICALFRLCLSIVRMMSFVFFPSAFVVVSNRFFLFLCYFFYRENGKAA
jgi:hypothetical protein